jgi:HAD superfamily hydrolase (TIGR01484 family)
MAVKLVAFDLDGTLAPSKGPISSDMAKVLADLLDTTQVCIISGGTQKQIFEQVLDRLPVHAKLNRLHIMPTSGAKYIKKHFGSWKTVYEYLLTEAEVSKISMAIQVSAVMSGVWEEEPYGPAIENRGTQVTYSALGQHAPRHEKEHWDREGTKKERLRSSIQDLLPGFDVRAGGSTSIDVTKIGVDKGFGILELSRLTGIPVDKILFFGDRLDPDGNDYPVIQTGVMVQSVSGPAETLKHIKFLVRTI